MTDVERLRRALERSVMQMRVVVSSPVCHPHNAIVLRDAISDAEKVLDAIDNGPDTDDQLGGT